MDEKEVKTDSLSKQMKKKEEITEVKTTMPKERKNSGNTIFPLKILLQKFYLQKLAHTKLMILRYIFE